GCGVFVCSPVRSFCRVCRVCDTTPPPDPPPCAACFHLCKKCAGPQDYKCLDCKPGWILHDNKCVDVDECGTELARCPSNTFCHNTEGSYECRGCDQACVGCMGTGPARCKKCARGYKLRGAKCLGEDAALLLSPPERQHLCFYFYDPTNKLTPSSSSAGPEKGLFDDMTDDEVLVLQEMFFGIVICAIATLAAKGDMVFTAIFIGGVAAMAGYWLTEKGDYMLDGFLKGR
uniref:EGF-like calcium-binding domain-containing protein n=1 Tax=Gasterosteus aculeatus aculeatus TaxID=481459 RepID=A0AAQ4QJY9_GASAC